METQVTRAIAHLNIIGFRAAVAALEDSSLKGRPYVIAGGTGGRAIAWDASAEAIKQNIRPGMPLHAAERLVKDLAVIPPNATLYKKINAALVTVIERYAPAWQNDGFGNLYLDLTGTQKLFGPPVDCISHIQNEILDTLSINAAAASATNKLVSKVASRAIRPAGLVDIRAGDEETFLRHQDITLLPGLGPSLMKTIRVTGFKEAGELASLNDSEAISLFGSKGPLLRDYAKGIDNSPVTNGNTNRVIERQLDFAEDVIDETVIMGALASLAEHSGLEMRKEKLGMKKLRIGITYNDGVIAQDCMRSKKLLITDKEITAAAYAAYKKAVSRRIRLRSICLELSDLSPLGYEPDLFESEENTKTLSLQQACDSIKERFGSEKVTRGIVLAATGYRPRAKLLQAASK